MDCSTRSAIARIVLHPGGELKPIVEPLDDKKEVFANERAYSCGYDIYYR